MTGFEFVFLCGLLLIGVGLILEALAADPKPELPEQLTLGL